MKMFTSKVSSHLEIRMHSSTDKNALCIASLEVKSRNVTRSVVVSSPYALAAMEEFAV